MIKVAILVLVDSVLQLIKANEIDKSLRVAILVLVDSVLQYQYVVRLNISGHAVAILVLVDSVLQFIERIALSYYLYGRNPCFSGQCFAI